MLKNINPDEIHIFYLKLNGIYDHISVLTDLLSPDEILRADKFKSDDNRLIYIAARGWLRKLLGLYTAIYPQDVLISTTASGKPFINGELKFNLSHSGDLIVYSFCLYSDIGIDTEVINPSVDHLDIAKHVFTESELCYLRNASDQEQLNNRFYRLWTRKEAVVKAEGTGLHTELKKIDVLTDYVSGSSLPDSIIWRVSDIELNSSNKTALAYSAHHNKLIIEQV